MRALFPYRSHGPIAVGHYLSVPAEAATFLFSVNGVDWVTWLYHAILFSPLFVYCTRGACPRFRRLGNSYVAWRHDARKLCGTSATDDELGVIKTTFSILFVPALIGTVLVIGSLVVDDVPYFSFRPPLIWHLPWGSGFSWLAWSMFGVLSIAGLYLGLIVVMISIFPQKLVGTRPASLPTFMSLLVRASAPQYMISYSWGGERDQSLLMLAHGLAEVLPDCWIDVRRLVPGQRLLDEVRLPAEHARVLIVLMNPAYVKSTNCGHELLAALKKRDPSMHRTIVLIEPPNLVVGYAPSWQRIHELLKGAGFDVVRSVESKPLSADAGATSGVGLLEWLDTRACRHDTADAPDDARKTMAWFGQYEDGIAEATSSAQDMRLPWNFFISARKGADNKMVTTEFVSQPIKYLTALLFQCRSPSALSTGLGGTWLAANAAAAPRLYAAWSPSVLSALVVGVLLPAVVLFLLFVLKWSAPDDLAGGFLSQLGTGPLFFIVSVAPLAAFAVRWGNVLAPPGWLLHSPELFVPLLVRELSQFSVPHRSAERNARALAVSHKTRASDPPCTGWCPATWNCVYQSASSSRAGA